LKNLKRVTEITARIAEIRAEQLKAEMLFEEMENTPEPDGMEVLVRIRYKAKSGYIKEAVFYRAMTLMNAILSDEMQLGDDEIAELETELAELVKE
jgi:3-dehydroquinate dehydratase